MNISFEEQCTCEMNTEVHNIVYYCLTVFERYESLLSEFGNVNGYVDHDKVLNKIDECNIALRNVLELDDGTFMATVYELLNKLKRFSESIDKRKIKEASERVSIPFHNKHSVESESASSKYMYSVQNTIETPRVNGFDSLAGLEEIKKILKTMFVLPTKQPQLFMNRKTSNKLLLFGPPGTGKTLLVHAVAAEMKAVFYNISSSDILSSFVGESEKMFKYLFQNAKRNIGYTIIFMDEIDAFCRKRDSADQQHSRRLITEIMCQMNTIEECPNIFVIGATNCPWDLDPAIMRRFQKRIFVPLPDRSEREELLRFHTDQIKLSAYEAKQWNQLLDLTEGLSTSDVVNLVQNAMDIPLIELQETRVWKRTIDDFYEPADREDNYSTIIWKTIDDIPENSVRARNLRLTDIISAAQNHKPTVSKDFILRYEAFNKK